MNPRSLLASGLLLASAGPLPAVDATPTPAAATPNAERLKWFDDARFGMFIHWGVYAVPAGEWQGKPVNGIGEWIMKNGKIPVKDYRAFARDFTAADYDPAAWAKLAHDAGMRYIVITSKHHDGFALYDSKVTDWDVMNSGAKRDLLAPLAAAARAQGLRFGLYYSQAQDWNHPGGGKAGGNKSWDPAQDGDYDAYLAKIALPQVKEIVAAYQPDILWWDTPVDMTPERVKPFAEFMAQHPQIINNNRLGSGFAGDTKTPEQNIPPRGYPGERFEVCMTMNDTWGYKKNDHNWKSVRQILRNLSDIASKGGNFLLNVGPTPNGVIPPESVERLQAVGRWMDVNGEAIHGTQAGPFPRRLPWGRVTQRVNPDGTQTLYAQVWDWPEDRRVVLPTVTVAPTKARWLAGGNATTKVVSEGLEITLPEKPLDADVSVARLDFAAPVKVTQEPFITPGADGRVVFGALDADAHGHYDGNIQTRGSGADVYLTDWKNAKWSLEYRFQAPSAGTWEVSAEVAAPEASSLNLTVNKVAQPVNVPATGPGLTWKTLPLGKISLPAGETGFTLQGVAQGWKPVSIRHVWLTPVKTP